MKNDTRQITVDGHKITFFHYAGSPFWQARFFGAGFPPDGKTKSTKMREFPEAKAEAKKILYGLKALHDHGIDTSAKSFGKVAQEWTDNFSHRNNKQEREYKSLVKRYFVPWFHDQRKLKINGITPKDIGYYKKWRKAYWITGPGKDITEIQYERGGKKLAKKLKPVSERTTPTDSRIRIEDTVLRKIFAYAVEQSYLSPSQVPQFKSPKLNTKDPNHRVAFRDEQVEAIERTILDRQSWNERQHVKHHWKIIGLYWVFGIETGARPPHEITSVKWGDISVVGNKSKETLDIQVEDSKTGRRPIVGTNKLYKVLKGWRKRTKFPTDDDYVFCKPDGSRLKDPDKAMLSLFKQAGQTHNRGEKLTQYGMRHYYITHALRNGVSVYFLASQCGTSVQMIERYYSDAVAPEMKDAIIKGKTKPQPANPWAKDPDEVERRGI